MENPAAKANKLISEKSPYLIQHAYNPVNWYPWGQEAFDKADREDKPVFLSIGYSTCHWCHVMAHESFEDEDVAKILNRDFISVKLDREERPDVDEVYMQACQAMTGSGGWPMTIIMTPQKKPFFAATYLPKSSRYGLMGLVDLLESVSYQWKTKRDRLLHDSEQISTYLQHREGEPDGGKEPSREQISTAKRWFERSFDKTFGGFGSSPKFPIPHNIIFLLRYSKLERDEMALNMAEHTLTQMYRGGIFDHIGGGFSRYSTDDKWLVPHFEKMLYDNALLIWAYVDAYAQTSRELYKTVAERSIGYVFRELTDSSGAFFCGQDADSEGVEGKYYVFSPEEVTEVLGNNEGADFSSRYDITERGNFEDKSIPNLLKNPDFEAVTNESYEAFRKLYYYRLSRTVLHKDDKVLCSWNALMIIALSRAGRILMKREYTAAAEKTQRFICDKLMDASGRLKIRWREGQSANDGQLDDYAFLGLAFTELYSATLDVSYLKRAKDMAEHMCELFLDEEHGGFFMYSSEGEQLLTRPKPVYDGALPAGNSAAALLLQRLFDLTGEESIRLKKERQLSYLASFTSRESAGHSLALLAFCDTLYPSFQLICVTGEGEAPEELWGLLSRKSDHNLTVLLKSAENSRTLAEVAPYTESYPVPESGALYYLCRAGSCLEPTKSLEEIEGLIV